MNSRLKLVFIGIFIVLSIFLPRSGKLRLINSVKVQAQATSYDQAFQSYLSTLDNYRKQVTEFENAKTFYLQAKTLNQKERVRLETYDMLRSRDELLNAYVIVLRARLMETPDHPGNEKGDIVEALRHEYEWYELQKNIYNQSSDTIEMLFGESKITEDHYNQITAPLVYRSLSTLAYSKFLDAKIRHENIYKVLAEKVAGADASKSELYQRWTVDIINEFQTITNYELEAKTLRENIAKSPGSAKSIYDRFISIVNNAEESFIRLNGFLHELYYAVR